MSINEIRVEKMRALLEAALTPSALDIVDDSEAHRGHAGAQSGAGHFTVIISSPLLADKSRVEAHRMIYQALADMMPGEIHALKIVVK
jgi:BolA protein